MGVIAALEVIRTIRESGIQTYAPVAAVNWTNEYFFLPQFSGFRCGGINDQTDTLVIREGVRFFPGCTGSAVWSSHTNIDAAQSMLVDDSRSQSTMADELARIGYLGSVAADYHRNPLSAHFELHIEQNNRLEQHKKRLGVVEGVQGIKWYKVACTGERAHAGSTPMRERADAVVASAKVITALEKLARAHKAFATVGVLKIESGSSNTVPGKVHFTVDIRHPSAETLDSMEREMQTIMEKLMNENPKIVFALDLVWHSPAVRFDSVAVECVASAAQALVGDRGLMRMSSFAGHDSALTALKVPTAMIFVPSSKGISHAPEEYTTKEQW